MIAGNPTVVAEIAKAIAEADALSEGGPKMPDEEVIKSAFGKWLDKAPTLSLVSTAAVVLLSHAVVMLFRGRKA